MPFTLGGTAVSGTDYSGVTASPLVIPAGQTTGTITGTLIDDGKFNTTNKTLTLTLGTPTNATLGTTTIDTLTINESDPQPTVQFASAAQSVNENGGTFTVTVNLSAASSVDTTIPFTLGGTAVSGTDYSGVTEPVGHRGRADHPARSRAHLIDDGKFSTTNKTLTLTLGTPTNATLGANTTDTLTITESDPEPTVQFAVRDAERQRERRHIHRHGQPVGRVQRRHDHTLYAGRHGGQRHGLQRRHGKSTGHHGRANQRHDHRHDP